MFFKFRYMSLENQQIVIDWFSGKVDNFTLDGSRSVILDGLKIKGCGFNSNKVEFKKWNGGPKNICFDFEGNAYEDICSGHNSAYFGGLTYQQAHFEYINSIELKRMGIPIIDCLGYGSVKTEEGTSYFSLHNWSSDIKRSRDLYESPEDLNLLVSHIISTTKQNILKKRMFGYFACCIDKDRSFPLLDLHPMRKIVPSQTSSITATFEYIWSVNIQYNFLFYSRKNIESLGRERLNNLVNEMFSFNNIKVLEEDVIYIKSIIRKAISNELNQGWDCNMEMIKANKCLSSIHDNFAEVYDNI